MCPCQCTLIPCCGLGKLWKRRERKGKRDAIFSVHNVKWVITLLVFATCLQENQHSSDIKTALFTALGTYSLALGRKATMKRWEKHMILVKSWLSLTSLAFGSFVQGGGNDRNRIVGSFYSCAQWGFKNEITSTARHSTKRSVVEGWCVHGVRGCLASLYISEPRGSPSHSLHFWKILSLSLPRSKQLVPSGAPTHLSKLSAWTTETAVPPQYTQTSLGPLLNTTKLTANIYWAFSCIPNIELNTLQIFSY